jgi:hypothetical protein
MKNTSIRFTIAAFAVVALNVAFIAEVRADRQSRADATAILTSGTWHFKSKNISSDRVFDPKGTMTVKGEKGKDSVAKWKVDYKEVTITYSYYTETLTLPLDPKGTSGLDGWGDELTATLQEGATPIATPTPVPTGLDALQTAPATPAQSSIVAVLTARKWHFAGTNWADDRTFAANGTVTVENGRTASGPGRWQIVGGQLVMTFSDHREILALPLDPKGTKGADSLGHAFAATQEVAAATPTPAPSSGDSYFGSTSKSEDVPSPTPYMSPMPAGK